MSKNVSERIADNLKEIAELKKEYQNLSNNKEILFEKIKEHQETYDQIVLEVDKVISKIRNIESQNREMKHEPFQIGERVLVDAATSFEGVIYDVKLDSMRNYDYEVKADDGSSLTGLSRSQLKRIKITKEYY